MKTYSAIRVLTPLLGLSFSLAVAAALNAAAAPVWLHFDNLPSGTWITDQFEAQGVHIVSDYRTGQSYRSAPQILAHPQARSAPNVLVNQAFDREIHNSRNVPLVFWFDEPISGVGMQLGCVEACSGSLTAVVKLFDCHGALQASGSIAPRPDFAAPLQVLDPTGTSRTVVIDYGDSGTPEAIDELAFQPSGKDCLNTDRPTVEITSHENGQVLLQPNILLQGTAWHSSGIITGLTVHGEPAALTPELNAVGVLVYHFSIPLVLKEGFNSITARVVGPVSSIINSQTVTVSVGAPASVQLKDFHLTQRGLMRTNSPCDVDEPLVAGKFTIVRARFDARTASDAESYVDSVLMSLWRRVNGNPVLVDSFWGELYSPQTVNFTSASDLAAVHFWIPPEKVDLAGDYAMTFQPYVGGTPIGPSLEVPCADRWFTFADTKPVRLLILPVEAQLFDPNLLPEDHDRVFEQFEWMSRLYPIRAGYSSLWSSEKTGIKYTYTMPHRVCDGVTQSEFCQGTGFEWRFKDTHPSGLWRPDHQTVIDANITTCLNDHTIGGRIVDTNLINLPRPTKFGLFTPGTPSQWEWRRSAWPLDDNHNGTIDDDLPHYVGEFFDAQTSQWLTDLSQYDHGETFRSYVDANGNYCHDKDSEPKLPMHRKWDNVGSHLLWAPASKAFSEYNSYISGFSGVSGARADHVTLWLHRSFHPTRTDFHQFDPGSGDQPGYRSWVTPGPYPVLAHELGHNLNRDHADDAPPYWQAYEGRTRVTPSGVFSLMTAGFPPTGEAFFRDADYLGVFEKLKADNPARTASPQRLLGEGSRTLSFDAVLDPEGNPGWMDFRLTAEPASEEPDPASPFRLRIGAGSRPLVDVGVPLKSAGMESWATGEAMILASLATPWPEAAEWLEVELPGQRPVRYPVSSEAPRVDLLEPNGGETFADDEIMRIEWVAEDPDGDPLVYSLYYSPDGAEWLPVAVGLTENAYELETSGLPGGTEARIRVIASDRFNESQDESDRVFEVAGKPPIVRILNPTPDSRFLEWDSIPLTGAVLDPEGLPVDARWYLDGGGRPFGTGLSQSLPPLAPGSHSILFSVQDAEGHTVEVERSFEVVSDSDRDGMSDEYEEQEGLEPSLADDALSDPDHDGLPSFEEAWRGLHAGSPDSDGDGVNDGDELNGGFDPLDPVSHPDLPDLHFFTDTFDGPEWHEAWETPGAGFTLAGGEVQPNGPRAYVRTVVSDYSTLDFEAEIIYSMNGGVGPAGLFFGLGPAMLDPGFFNEPLSSIYAVDHAADFPFFQGTAVRSLPASGAPVGHFLWADPGTLSDGTHALRLVKQGDQLTWQMDHLYNGATFEPAYSGSLALADLPFLDASNSHLFFGTDASPTRIREFRVTLPVPVLEVALIGKAVVLSWPLAAGNGWRLESTPQLNPPVTWVETPPPYATDSSAFHVTESMRSGSRFYRLRNP